MVSNKMCIRDRYIIGWAWTSVISLIFFSPAMNILSNIASLFLIFLPYRIKKTKKCLAVFVIYVINALVDSIVILSLTKYMPGQPVNQVYECITSFILLLIAIIIQRTTKSEQEIDVYKRQKVITVPMLFSGGMIANYLVMTKVLMLKNTIWALILPLCMNSFNVIVLRTFFKTSIPDSVVESAKIDGASEWKLFFRIVIPMAMPGLATIGLFLTLGYWNDWFNALMYLSLIHI